MSKKKKPSNPVKVMIIWTVVLAIITAAASFGGQYIADYRADIMAEKKAEVEENNAQIEQEYRLAKAEYDRKSAEANAVSNEWPAQKTEGWDVVDLTGIPLENAGSVSVNRADVLSTGLLLVNEWHSRPDDFSEERLMSIGENAKGVVGVQNYSQKLLPESLNALVTALNDAKALGLKGYVVNYAYRSWDDQNNLFQSKMQSFSNRYEGDALIARTKKEVNYPGTSEFNTGLSFTLYLYESGNTELNNTPFSTSQQGQWLYENGWKYGLVFRFPLEDFPVAGTLDKSYKTGVSVEMNCFRYVGKAHAAAMNHLGLCLEEYIEYLMAHPHIAVFENGQLRYEIVRQEVGNASTLAVEINRNAQNYSMSLDNMGGVVTVFEY